MLMYLTLILATFSFAAFGPASPEAFLIALALLFSSQLSVIASVCVCGLNIVFGSLND
jgi:membrane protein YqaA with SNARE-associated domain